MFRVPPHRPKKRACAPQNVSHSVAGAGALAGFAGAGAGAAGLTAPPPAPPKMSSPPPPAPKPAAGAALAAPAPAAAPGLRSEALPGGASLKPPPPPPDPLSAAAAPAPAPPPTAPVGFFPPIVMATVCPAENPARRSLDTSPRPKSMPFSCDFIPLSMSASTDFKSKASSRLLNAMPIKACLPAQGKKAQAGEGKGGWGGGLGGAEAQQGGAGRLME